MSTFEIVELELDELSIVDRPANQHARVLLTKSAGTDEIRTSFAKFDLGLAALKKSIADYYAEFPEDAMDQGEVIQKNLIEDLAKGQVTVLKADVERLAKARADEIWKARGCPAAGKAGILDEAFQTPLDPWLPASGENPPLRKIFDAAPASREVSKARSEILGEREQLEQQMAALIEKAVAAHPDWSRLKVLDHVYSKTPEGVKKYARYVALGHKLERAQ